MERDQKEDNSNKILELEIQGERTLLFRKKMDERMEKVYNWIWKWERMFEREEMNNITKKKVLRSAWILIR